MYPRRFNSAASPAVPKGAARHLNTSFGASGAQPGGILQPIKAVPTEALVATAARRLLPVGIGLSPYGAGGTI